MRTKSIIQRINDALPKLHEFTDKELFKYALLSDKNFNYPTDYGFITVADRCGDFQTLRTLCYYHRHYKRKSNLHNYLGEVQRVWISPTGDWKVERKLRRPFSSWSMQPFSLWSELSIRKDGVIYRIVNDNFQIRSLIPQLKLRGIKNANTGEFSNWYLYTTILKDSYLETLWKRGTWKIASRMYCDTLKSDTGLLNAYKGAADVACRNHYKIADEGIWCDMIKFLHLLGKDTRNAFYVCPDDLNAAHDKWQNLWNRKKAKIAETKRLAEEKEHAKEYADRIEKYLNIHIIGNGLHIFVCPTIHDMSEEGRHMHHCVASYWRYENSIILFVRDESNNRIATVELSKTTWSIVQTRGVCNKEPVKDGHSILSTINGLINSNMDLFKNPQKSTLKQKTELLTNAAIAA